jgi:3,4-dihydroxy 2-butanone 4-phosphate synthase / GTP cyclohydrolase II
VAVTVAVIGAIVAPDGSMSRGGQLRAFAMEHGLRVLAVADLVRYRRATERPVEYVA